jgi:hypothetical protein
VGLGLAGRTGLARRLFPRLSSRRADDWRIEGQRLARATTVPNRAGIQPF